MRLLPVGDAALSCDLGEASAPGVKARARALGRSLQAQPLPGQRECVPALTSVLVIFDPQVTTVAALGHGLRRRLDEHALEPTREVHEIPVRYGGPQGPDLAEVATRLGLAADEVVALHSGAEYEVEMLGFMPGFAYLGTLPDALELPRRATPRTRLPAGSVAIAGRQTGVYPAASPGGWHVLGRTNARLFDPARRPPGLEDVARFHPTFLYESLWDLAICAALLLLARALWQRLPAGSLFALYLALYGAGRVVLEGIRIDPAAMIDDDDRVDRRVQQRPELELGLVRASGRGAGRGIPGGGRLAFFVQNLRLQRRKCES